MANCFVSYLSACPQMEINGNGNGNDNTRMNAITFRQNVQQLMKN